MPPLTTAQSPEEITFREAGIHDAPAIARTEVASKLASLPGFVSPIEVNYDARLERWMHYINRTRSPNLALDPRIVILACAEQDVVGYIACHQTTKWSVDAELQSLYLLKPYQGRGIGTALFSLSVAWLEKSGLRSLGVGIHPNSPYNRFYEKLGGVQRDAHTYTWTDWRQLQSLLPDSASVSPLAGVRTQSACPPAPQGSSTPADGLVRGHAEDRMIHE
jgi:GNAT superfamily N-acetyltransferase